MNDKKTAKPDNRQRPPGETGRSPTGVERRSARRFDISTSDTWISTIPRYTLLNVSAAGAGLTSTHPVRPGDYIRVALKGGPAADARVVYCMLEPLPQSHLVSNFHLGCKFISKKEATDLTNRIEYQLASVLG